MMWSSTRRDALGAMVASGLMTRAGGSAAEVASTTQADLTRYIDFGIKASGGPGDEACGSWLEERLRTLGMATRRQAFPVPSGETAGVLTAGPVETPIWCPPTQAGLALRSVPIVHLEDPRGAADCVAVARLPFRRWSSAKVPLVRQAARRAHDLGAQALILVTDGPTGETIALNVSEREPTPVPLATVGPRHCDALVAAAWRRETVDAVLPGRAEHRSAFNLVGETGSSGLRLVVSTPRSGWFACGGERGPGVAVWLALARWAASARGVRATFVATSGHEFEGLGAEHYLATEAPSADAVDLWVHLGANLATRDARDLGADLQFLPSGDPQHYLVAHAGVKALAESAFAGVAGLGQAFDPVGGAAGELQTLTDHGYSRLLGVFGAHRLHHTAIDDARSVSPELTRQAGDAFLSILDAVLQEHQSWN